MNKVAIINLSDYQTWFKGGIMSYVNNILPYFLEHYECKDNDVSVFGCSVNGRLPKEFHIDGRLIDIKVYTDVKTHRKIIPNFLRSFFSVYINRKAFRKYNIIHSHTSATTLGLRLFCPTVFVAHHQHGLSYKKVAGHRRILNLGYTLAQIKANVNFIVASEEDVIKHRNKMRKYTKAKFICVGSPIKYDKEYIKIYDRKNVPNFVYTGRIDDWKNTIMMAKAFLSSPIPSECTLDIYGDGPSFQQLEKFVQDNNAANRIILHGFKSNKEVLDVLKKYDIFLFPSRGEGMPLSVLEAYAKGIPVVGFDVIGVKNLIDDGVTGILVKQITSEAFSKGIFDVTKKYKEMSANCRQFAQQYDSIEIAKKIYNAIDKEYYNE